MGTFLFVGGQRGFTLVETVVAVGIVALLAVVVTLSLALRPGALRATVASFDASFATARAIAATSGNGATIVVALRGDAHGRLPGFTLRIYRGRPTAANAVTLADAPAVIADADIREATLGSPPFAIFLSSAGTASGLAAYPTFEADGTPQFAPIAAQPPCPSGGLTLTFISSHASQTRVLPCGARAFGSPIPLATESPAPLLLTPKALVFHWPGAPVQTFVATEWGYTRWFAADNFACGANVAQFPQSDPTPPYSLPNSPDDENAAPLAPMGVPVSYANAPDSMQDAPARFPLAPSTAGVCTATVADAFGQKTTIGVQVMGQIEAGPDTLSWAADDSAPRRIVLGKTWDGDRLNPVLMNSTCAGIATATVSGTPLIPAGVSETASVRAVTITPVMSGGTNAGGSCAFTFASQYAGEPPAVVSINIAGGHALQTWPAQVKYATQGGTFTVGMMPNRLDPGYILNGLMGGGIALAQSQCSAQALGPDGVMPDTSPPQWAVALGATTDLYGCFSGKIYSNENNGQSKTWSVPVNTCTSSVLRPGIFSPGVGAASSMLPIVGTTAGTCSFDVDDGTGGAGAYYGGLVGATVVSGTTQKWVADYELDWQDPCDQQTGECRMNPPLNGTAACNDPILQAGGYYFGTVKASDMDPNIARAVWPGGVPATFQANSYFGDESVDIHNDWITRLEVQSCYDANRPGSIPVEN